MREAWSDRRVQRDSDFMCEHKEFHTRCIDTWRIVESLVWIKCTAGTRSFTVRDSRSTAGTGIRRGHRALACFRKPSLIYWSWSSCWSSDIASMPRRKPISMDQVDRHCVCSICTCYLIVRGPVSPAVVVHELSALSTHSIETTPPSLLLPIWYTRPVRESPVTAYKNPEIRRR